MQCTRCGNQVSTGSSFCAHCGEPVRDVPTEPSDGSASGPSPFSREAVTQPTTSTTTAYGDQTPEPVPGPPADLDSYGTPRTVAEIVAGLSNGVLGLVAVGVYGALQVLWAVVAALNDDRPSKGGFVVLALLLVAAAGGATGVLLQRAKAAREAGDSLDVVHALSVGAGVLVSVYGALLVLTALVSDEAQALGRVF